MLFLEKSKIMGKRIIIAGATGLIGKRIIYLLLNKGYSVCILTRNIESAMRRFNDTSIDFINWDYSMPSDNLIEYIENSFAVINFAGASIGGKRWNESYKRVLYDSRIVTTRKIAEAISKCKNKPECLINSSAIGYYGTTRTEVLDEDSKPGDDFLSKLCFDWEKEAYSMEKHGLRVITLRIGIVLDKCEGALQKFLLTFKLFIGGHQGSGKQWISWIHIDDLVNLIFFVLENKEIKGAINCTSPNSVSNKQFCKTLGKVLNRPSIFPVPGFVLKIAIGEFAKYLIKGRKVIPFRATKNGFQFRYDNLENALTNLLK